MRFCGVMATVFLFCEVAMSAGVDLDREPGAFETPYAPAPGATLSMTPPTFVWQRVAGAQKYILQYSSDPAFSPGATTTVECPRSIHTPSAVLAPGRWHWRYGLGQGDGKGATFSRVRAFTIAPDAVKVPFPDVAEVVRRLAAQPHPRIEMPAGGLEKFRADVATRWKDQAAGLAKGAAQYVGKPLLEEPAFLPPPKDPKRGEIYTKTFRTTRPFIGGMEACAFAYLVTGDEPLGQEARRRLMHIMAWDPKGSTSLGHNDEPGTEIVRIGPRVYDRIHPLLSAEEREKCRQVFAVRMPQLFEALRRKPFEVNPYESHAMGYYLPDLTEACIAMAGEMDVTEWLGYCLQMLWAPFYPPFGGEEGGWSEGPSYWGWSTKVFLRAFVLVQRATGLPIAHRPWMRSTGYFKLYGNPPYSKMSPFGDAQSTPAGSPDTVYQLGAFFSDPYLLWYAGERKYAAGLRELLVVGEPRVAPKAPDDLPQSRCFHDVGLACVHSRLGRAEENVHFMMRSSPFGSTSHAYADQNAFILHAFGEPLAVASGYYPYYGSPHHRSWTWETKAANCITADGKGQETRNWFAKGRITRCEDKGSVCYIVGDATAAYGGRLAKFLRRVVYLRPASPEDGVAVIIVDELEGKAPVTFQWWLHALDEMQVDAQRRRVEIHRERARLRVQFLEPQGLEFSQTDQFAAPPEGQFPNQWHLTVSTRERSSACRFVTVLLPYKAGGEAALGEPARVEGEACIAVAIQRPAGRTVALLRTGGKADEPMRAGAIRAAGEAAVAIMDKDGKAQVVELGRR